MTTTPWWLTLLHSSDYSDKYVFFIRYQSLIIENLSNIEKCWKMSPRGLEPRTFCVWGRCDDHYAMVTHNVKLFRSCQITLINTAFYKILVCDNREPFEHWKMSLRGLEPRTFCMWGRCDDHYTMVTHNVKIFRSCQNTLINTVFSQNISVW